MERTFPADWPEGCPPGDAETADGEVFRLVRGAPPSPADFRTHAELGKLPDAPPCLRRGLSCFRERADALHQQRLLPRLGKYLARGLLRPEHGVTKATPTRQPSHITWWSYAGVDRAAPFDTVEELS